MFLFILLSIFIWSFFEWLEGHLSHKARFKRLVEEEKRREELKEYHRKLEETKAKIPKRKLKSWEILD
jgi:hypothetical protein